MNRKCVGMSRRRRPNAPPARLSEAAVFSRQFSHSRRDNLIGNISFKHYSSDPAGSLSR